MSNFSSPIAVDLGEAGQVYVSYEDVNGTGEVEIRWFQGDEEVPHMAAPHYDVIFRLIEVLLWAAMGARSMEKKNYWTLDDTGITPYRTEVSHYQQYRRGKDGGIEVWTPHSGNEGAWEPMRIAPAPVGPPGEKIELFINGEPAPGTWVYAEGGIKRVEETGEIKPTTSVMWEYPFVEPLPVGTITRISMKGKPVPGLWKVTENGGIVRVGDDDLS